ncbi:MAG TPA: Maf family protein, partial [Thermoleophilaceae bacterium]|nr:Maf family protein [Thermoleophilaceae bacterium]
MGSQLLLASRSPQRRAILEQLGVEFDVAVPDVEELEEGDPRALALENALRKARAAAPPRTRATVLGVDTVVSSGGRVLGKPRDERQAHSFLSELSDRAHEVHSGLALIGPDGERTEGALTRVRFRRLAQSEIDWYLAGGEWRERAGGYAIQGRGAA